MKRFSLMLMLAIMTVSSAVFAGSIDYLSNQSAKQVMTISRGGATDTSADLANYNPAATAFFAPGLYIDFSNQTLFKPYEQTYKFPALAGGANKTVDQSEPTLFLPNLYAVYNAGQVGLGNLAVYMQLGITAGGGTLKWDDGTAGTQGALAPLAGGNPILKQEFEATSVYYGISAGLAYASPDNTVAVSAGARVLIPKREIKLSTAIGAAANSGSADIEYDAVGWAPIIGFSVKPIKDLALSLRYEFETVLYMDYSVSTSGLLAGSLQSALAAKGFSDGKKANSNMPAMLSLGAEYKVNSELTVLLGLNRYYLSKCESFGDDEYNTGYDASIGATYRVMPELLVGCGFSYTGIGVEDKYYENSDNLLFASAMMPLDQLTFGVGGTYTVMPGLDVTLSFLWGHYLSDSWDVDLGTAGKLEVEYKKDVYDVAIGVSYKVF